jgi:hypothetical protein
MNYYTESFDQFANKLGPTDLALYAGVGLIVWLLFKDKLSPVQVLVLQMIQSIKGLVNKKPTVVDEIKLPETISSVVVKDKDKEDVFFKLVVSWKQTRELAMLSGCKKAVEVADEMFPYLSPNVCEKET